MDFERFNRARADLNDKIRAEELQHVTEAGDRLPSSGSSAVAAAAAAHTGDAVDDAYADAAAALQGQQLPDLEQGAHAAAAAHTQHTQQASETQPLLAAAGGNVGDAANADLAAFLDENAVLDWRAPVRDAYLQQIGKVGKLRLN
jgi:hypothetical protein